MNKLSVFLLSFISINSFACSFLGENIDEIRGVEYKVIKINDQNLFSDKKPFLVFDKNKNGYFAYGSSGCNNFRSQVIENNNGSFKLTKVMGTKKLCNPSRNNIEKTFLSKIPERDFFLSEENDYLILKFQDEKIYLKKIKD